MGSGKGMSGPGGAKGRVLKGMKEDGNFLWPCLGWRTVRLGRGVGGLDDMGRSLQGVAPPRP